MKYTVPFLVAFFLLFAFDPFGFQRYQTQPLADCACELVTSDSNQDIKENFEKLHVTSESICFSNGYMPHYEYFFSCNILSKKVMQKPPDSIV